MLLMKALYIYLYNGYIWIYTFCCQEALRFQQMLKISENLHIPETGWFKPYRSELDG